MSIILNNYLHEYRMRLRRRAEQTSLPDAVSVQIQDYYAHLRQVNETLTPLRLYSLSNNNPLAKRLLKKARLAHLLALEDLNGLQHLATLHPTARPALEDGVACCHDYLLQFEDVIFYRKPSQNFSPSRSA